MKCFILNVSIFERPPHEIKNKISWNYMFEKHLLISYFKGFEHKLQKCTHKRKKMEKNWVKNMRFLFWEPVVPLSFPIPKSNFLHQLLLLLLLYCCNICRPVIATVTVNTQVFLLYESKKRYMQHIGCNLSK